MRFVRWMALFVAVVGGMVGAASVASATPLGAGTASTVPTAADALVEKAHYYRRPYYRPRYFYRPVYYRRYYRPRVFYAPVYYRPRIVCRIRYTYYGPRRVCFRRY